MAFHAKCFKSFTPVWATFRRQFFSIPHKHGGTRTVFSRGATRDAALMVMGFGSATLCVNGGSASVWVNGGKTKSHAQCESNNEIGSLFHSPGCKQATGPTIAVVEGEGESEGEATAPLASPWAWLSQEATSLSQSDSIKWDSVFDSVVSTVVREFDLAPINVGAILGLGAGGALGFMSGLAVKKTTKTAGFVCGLGFIALQALAHKGWVEVKWTVICKEVEEALDQNGDGKFCQNDAGLLWNKTVLFLSKGLGATAGFVPGLVMGFRYG